MLALYRCGRQAEALGAFQAARERFVTELGIEPAEPLRELHADVLQHAAELAPPPEPRPWPATPGTRGLPLPPNRTIGRERDLVAVCERLRAESVRLLTLTGPGGVGKTRLAVEAARAVRADFADGAQLVSLAALHRPRDVATAIVNALGIIVLSGESADQAAERFLAVKHLLLVIDNLEQLLPAAPFIAGLLAACPSLTVLATSREPLALQAEERYPVAPLALPEPGTPREPEALAGTAAVALFCQRARAHDPEFLFGAANAAAVAEICRRVDGLPLAIELAAARCGLLTPAEIAQRLDAAVGVPGAGVRDGPRASRRCGATIDWSHDLLSDDEKTVLRALRRVRRRRHGRGGRGDHRRRTRRPSTAWSTRACSRAARTRSPPPGWQCSRRSARTPSSAWRAPPTSTRSASATIAITWRWPSGTGSERALWGAAGNSISPRSTSRSTTCTGHWPWAIGRADAERATGDGGGARLVLAHARALLRRRRLGRAGPEPRAPTPIPPCACALSARRPACLWQMGRGAESPRSWPTWSASPGSLAIPWPFPWRSSYERLTKSAPNDSMSRTHSRTRRSAGQSRRRRMGDRRSVPRKGDCGAEHRGAARARRHGRHAARGRRQSPRPRASAHLRGLRRALPRQRA